MNPTQFQTAALELLKNYWRLKAANAIYRSSQDVVENRLEYSNVPAVGLAANQFNSESVEDAMSALQDFVVHRLPRDLFFALIAEFESRIVARLFSLGETVNGTLGQLQSRIQNRLVVPQSLIEDLNEIRERRNAIIHHGGKADLKYVTASAAVLPRANLFVNVTVAGDDVNPTEGYLAYSTDVLVRYSNSVG